MAANAALMQEQLGEQLLKAAQAVEQQVDQELERLDKLDDDELEKLRAQRLEQMRKMQRQKQDWLTNGHGEYKELADEREFFAACKASKRVVCHFYRDGTFRCKILDKHLRELAAKHIETRFITVNVERIERLNIRVIPTMALIKDGKTEQYIRGFDGISDKDDFPVELLERRLADTGITHSTGEDTRPKASSQPAKTIRAKRDSDSDDDW